MSCLCRDMIPRGCRNSPCYTDGKHDGRVCRVAVISELINSGLRLKQQRKLRGAIEHFRQLYATYPDHARIQFELANCWLAFGVPENALPHYQELLEPSKAKSLPPKDLPRLYTQLCATLHQLDENQAALEIAQAGIKLHPTYRPLRAWQIFALTATGAHQVAVLDALELLLESLAPSRWDIFEDDIKQETRKMRARLENATPSFPPTSQENTTPLNPPEESGGGKAGSETEARQPDSLENSGKQVIDVSAQADESPADADDHEVTVSVRPPAKKSPRHRLSQLGRRSVRINISGDEPSKDDPAAAAFKIPIDD